MQEIKLFLGYALLITTIYSFNGADGVPVSPNNETITNSTLEEPKGTTLEPSQPEISKGENFPKSTLDTESGNQTEIMKSTMIPATIDAKNQMEILPESTVLSKPGVDVNVSIPEELKIVKQGANQTVQLDTGNLAANISKGPQEELVTTSSPTELPTTDSTLQQQQSNNTNFTKGYYIVVTRLFRIVRPIWIRPEYEVQVPVTYPSSHLQVEGNEGEGQIKYEGDSTGLGTDSGSLPLGPGPLSVAPPVPVGAAGGISGGGGDAEVVVPGSESEGAEGHWQLPHGANYQTIELHERQIVGTPHDIYLLLARRP